MGATWAVEWPDQNQYWKDSKVRPFLLKRTVHSALVDGCMVGLRAKRPSHAGMPMRKRWRIVTNRKQLADDLSIVCDGSHNHAHVEGMDTKLTENYTEDFVNRVLDAWLNT